MGCQSHGDLQASQLPCGNFGQRFGSAPVFRPHASPPGLCGSLAQELVEVVELPEVRAAPRPSGPGRFPGSVSDRDRPEDWPAPCNPFYSAGA